MAFALAVGTSITHDLHMRLLRWVRVTYRTARDNTRLDYAACGVPAPLVVDTDGTAQREAFRHWLHASVQPLGSIVEAELREKLDAPDLALDFSALRASDFASTARAWRSLVGREATMPDADARRLAGLG